MRLTRPKTPRLRVKALAAWIVLALGIAGSFAASTGWQHVKREDAKGRFDRAVAQSSGAVQMELRRYVEALGGARAALRADGLPDEAGFERYVQGLDLATTYKGADGLAVIANVPTTQDRPAFITQRTAPRDRWVSLRYDLAGDAVLAETLRGARDAGRPMLSERFTPFSDPDLPVSAKHDGFTMVLPLYRTVRAPTTVAARRGALRGWVAVHFRGDTFMDGVLGTASLPLRLELFDGPDPDTAKELTGSQLDRKPATGGEAQAATVPLSVYGRSWALRAEALPGLSTTTEDNEHWLVLLAGLAITGAIFAVLFVLSTQKARVERLVEVTLSGLRESEGRFRSLAASSPTGIFHGDAAGNIVWTNQRLTDITGLAHGEALGNGWKGQIHPDDRALVQSALAAQAERGEFDEQLRLQRPDGETRWVHVRAARVEGDADRGVVGSIEDITDRKAFESELERQALHDALTGLPNRVLFHDRLAVALARASRADHHVGVLFIDLDRFKVVNDSLGHIAGDQLLVEVGERLLRAVRLSDTVARFGGDEFCVLCDELDGDRGAIDIADRIQAAFQQPVTIAGSELVVTASVGIALAEGAPTSPEDLVRDADAAMYRAKEKGKDRAELFDDQLRESALEHLDTENGLRRALERDEFVVLYQPKVNLRTGVIDAVEALVRWERPGHGLVPPFQFIPLAEETGLIVPIGAWVLRESCRQAAEWATTWPGAAPPKVAVNLAARQLMDPGTVDLVRDVLADTGLPPERLCLEITESTLMGDAEAAELTLRQLRDLGVSLAVDDFGTGYSSLSYLQRFPVDYLKVDRSFVMRLGGAEEESAIVEAITSMAHALDLKVVAEGIETEEQRKIVTNLGCDLGQGYLWSKPAEPAAIEAIAALEVPHHLETR